MINLSTLVLVPVGGGMTIWTGTIRNANVGAPSPHKLSQGVMMKRPSMFAVAMGIMVGVASASLSAQGMVNGPVHFGIMGGATIPTRYFASAYGGYDAHTHANAGAFFAVGVPHTPLSIRVDGQWQQLPSGGNASSAMQYRIIDGTANLVYALGSATRANVYLIGGGGVYRERARSEFFDYSATATHYGFNGGLGVNFRIATFAAFVEARYHYVVRGSRIGALDCNTLMDLLPHSCPADTRPSLQLIPISAGFAF